MIRNVLVAGLALGWALGWGGCVQLGEPVVESDDDDGSDEPDDHYDPDDWEDDCDPGDDWYWEAVTFRFDLLWAQGVDEAAERSDDDDSAWHHPDDDDSAIDGDDDDSAGVGAVHGLDLVDGRLEVEFVVEWWELAWKWLLCEQVYSATGRLRAGPAPFEGACEICDGLVLIDPDSVVPLEDPSDPGLCEPGWGAELELEALYMPTAQGGGDFLSIGLLSSQKMEETGLTFDLDGQIGWTQLQESMPGGAELSFVGLVDAAPGGMMEAAQLPQLAMSAQEGSTWTFFWFGSSHPAEEPWQRELRGQGYWMFWNYDAY